MFVLIVAAQFESISGLLLANNAMQPKRAAMWQRLSLQWLAGIEASAGASLDQNVADDRMHRLD